MSHDRSTIRRVLFVAVFGLAFGAAAGTGWILDSRQPWLEPPESAPPMPVARLVLLDGSQEDEFSQWVSCLCHTARGEADGFRFAGPGLTLAGSLDANGDGGLSGQDKFYDEDSGDFLSPDLAARLLLNRRHPVHAGGKCLLRLTNGDEWRVTGGVIIPKRYEWAKHWDGTFRLAWYGEVELSVNTPDGVRQLKGTWEGPVDPAACGNSQQ